MEYHRLGKAGLQTSAFALGIWQTFAETIDDKTAEAVLKAAWENGIVHFDGAEAYGLPHGRGNADALLGRLLKKLAIPREEVILASKVSRTKNREICRRGMSRKHIVECCEAALKRMQTDHLDLFYCHAYDSEVEPEEVVTTMNWLQQQGKILYWGTSNHPVEKLQELCKVAADLHMTGPSMEQCIYSMLYPRRVEKELQPVIESNGMGIVAFTPLAGGILTGKYNDGDLPEGSRFATVAKAHTEKEDWRKQIAVARALSQLAKDLGTTLTHLALAWTLRDPQVSCTILGASKPHYIEQNVRALDLVPKLTGDIQERIDQLIDKDWRVQ
jgi:aryl-alcohol dehydrogenase-like predicted oxidoreductase